MRVVIHARLNAGMRNTAYLKRNIFIVKDILYETFLCSPRMQDSLDIYIGDLRLLCFPLDSFVGNSQRSVLKDFSRNILSMHEKGHDKTTSPEAEILREGSGLRNIPAPALRMDPSLLRGKIREMIRLFRMRKLIRSVQELQSALGDGNDVTIGTLYGHSAATNLFEEWYLTLHRMAYASFGIHTLYQRNSHENSLRSKRVESVIRSCLKRNFLDTSRGIFIVTTEGEEFAEPLKFVSTVLDEYKPVTIFLVGVLGTSLAGVLWRVLETYLLRISF